MEKIDIINNIMKMTFISLCTYLVFLKSTDFKDNREERCINGFIVSIFSVLIGIFYAFAINKLNSTIIVVVSYFIYSIIISKITNNRIMYTITVTFIALGISFGIFFASIFISSLLLFAMLQGFEDAKNPIILLCAIPINLLFIMLLFKIKRFKRGFAIFSNKEKTENIGVLGMAFSAVAIVISSFLVNSENDKISLYLLMSIIAIAISIVIWISSKITEHYRQKMTKRAISDLENEIKEKEKTIEDLKEENSKIAMINHKYTNRLSALELSVDKLEGNFKNLHNFNTEFGLEFNTLKDQAIVLYNEYMDDIQKVKYKRKLPKTNIFAIDSNLEYMQEESIKNDISFELKINGSINYMTQKVLTQSELETLIGDHVRDAIIAVTLNETKHKAIMVILGVIEDNYELCIYDSGIEFGVETLSKLGREKVTTHKEDGGLGIGFMTTFELLKKYKASLIIEEKKPSNTDYTKAVRIRFDNKNEYRICSYRAEEIKLHNENSRILIEKV